MSNEKQCSRNLRIFEFGHQTPWEGRKEGRISRLVLDIGLIWSGLVWSYLDRNFYYGMPPMPPVVRVNHFLNLLWALPSFGQKQSKYLGISDDFGGPFSPDMLLTMRTERISVDTSNRVQKRPSPASQPRPARAGVDKVLSLTFKTQMNYQ